MTKGGKKVLKPIELLTVLSWSVRRLREVLKAIQGIINKTRIISLNAPAFSPVFFHLVHTTLEENQIRLRD